MVYSFQMTTNRTTQKTLKPTQSNESNDPFSVRDAIPIVLMVIIILILAFTSDGVTPWGMGY